MKHQSASDTHGMYRGLAIEMAVDFVIMYFVMYTMIASIDHLHLNVNNAYMTLMMVVPMTVVMLFGMRSMFPSRRLNLTIAVGATLVFAASFVAMRKQGAVGDEQFLRSMIPHHSGAILMCEQASLSDLEIVNLCEQTIRSQQKEIAQMEAILARE